MRKTFEMKTTALNTHKRNISMPVPIARYSGDITRDKNDFSSIVRFLVKDYVVMTRYDEDTDKPVKLKPKDYKNFFRAFDANIGNNNNRIEMLDFKIFANSIRSDVRRMLEERKEESAALLEPVNSLRRQLREELVKTVEADPALMKEIFKTEQDGGHALCDAYLSGDTSVADKLLGLLQKNEALIADNKKLRQILILTVYNNDKEIKQLHDNEIFYTNLKYIADFGSALATSASQIRNECSCPIETTIENYMKARDYFIEQAILPLLPIAPAA